MSGYELREKLRTESAVLQGCCQAAIGYLDEKETPFEQNLSRALHEQTWRVMELVDEVYNLAFD